MQGAVFITGGTGFIGSHVVTRLRDSGRAVVAPGRDELDLLDSQAVSAAISEVSATTVVHLAASLDKGSDEAQWRNTFELGRSVIDACVRSGVELLVASGTMDEVGLASGIVEPTHAACPPNVYGLCKSLLLDVARFAASRSKLQVEWFRPTAVYGPGQSGSMLVPSAFADATQRGGAQFTSGVQKRDFIYVDDVAEWIKRATEINVDHRGVTIHHLGTGRPVAVSEVLNGIAQLTGANFELGALPRRAGEADLFGVPVYGDDREPLAGWTPSTSLDEGLALTLNFWKSSSQKTSAWKTPGSWKTQ